MPPEVASLDLNLLVVFDAMMRHGSVTAAGQELGLSQPAASYALVKMRKSFGDPLFVRVSSGMQPTAHAMAMAPVVRDVLQRIKLGLLESPTFDPATSRREFRLATSDIGESFFVPPLVRALTSAAPGVRLHLYSSTPDVLARQLESGDIDLAIGYYPDLVGADFFQQALFTSNFVVIAATGNRYIRGQLTMSRLLEAPHIDVSTPGRSQEIILEHIAKRKIERNVPLHLSRFLSLMDIVPDSDLIAIVPREAALAFRKVEGITVHPLPFESPTFRLQQHWHRRFHDDHGVRWLRQLCHGLFKDC